jgi:DNA polymerase
MSDIHNFKSMVKQTIQTREECTTCPLYGAPSVILDTNRHGLGPVNVAFLGINPGKIEVEKDTPFVGPAGQELRKRIQKLPQGTTWLMTNFILCHTQNEAQIPDPELVIQKCLPLVRGIVSRFPASIYVPLGAKAMKTCKINGSITKLSGQLFRGNVLPLIHPSAILRSPRAGVTSNEHIFDKGFDQLIKHLNHPEGKLSPSK